MGNPQRAWKGPSQPHPSALLPEPPGCEGRPAPQGLFARDAHHQAPRGGGALRRNKKTALAPSAQSAHRSCPPSPFRRINSPPPPSGRDPRQWHPERAPWPATAHKQTAPPPLPARRNPVQGLVATLALPAAPLLRALHAGARPPAGSRQLYEAPNWSGHLGAPRPPARCPGARDAGRRRVIYYVRVRAAPAGMCKHLTAGPGPGPGTLQKTAKLTFPRNLAGAAVNYPGKQASH